MGTLLSRPSCLPGATASPPVDGAALLTPAAAAPASVETTSLALMETTIPAATGSAMNTQVSQGEFSAEGKGHAFELRRPISRVTARRCAACNNDISAHSRAEVSDEILLIVLDSTAEERASVITEGELLVGSFKSVADECARNKDLVVVNCAGTRLHDFLPRTAKPFDELRTAARLRDLNWEDSEKFVIDETELIDTLRWAYLHTHERRQCLVTCAQGKSRSGTFAACYLMAKRDISADAALKLIRDKRPLVEPNSGFLRQLRELETAVRAEGRRWKMLPRLLSPRGSPSPSFKKEARTPQTRDTALPADDAKM